MKTSDAFPTVGVPTTVSELPEGTTALVVTYQPEAPIASTQTVTVGGREVSWTPTQPGIAVIAAEGGGAVSIKRSIKFDGIPVTGVIICLVAATVLIGGAAWATRLLLRQS